MVALPLPNTPTVSAIYTAYEAAAETGWRAHLGASLIGTPCERAIWYSFRWASRARHTGRLLRLFETGNLAEARFVADLRRIGVTVLDLDPATGRHRGFGFVEYEDPGDAAAAIDNMNDAELNGRVLRVNLAQARDRGGGLTGVWGEEGG